MKLLNRITEGRNYWRLKRIQAALENNRLLIPLQDSDPDYAYTIESFCSDSLTLYMTRADEYSPSFTLRLFKKTALICFRIDTLTPHQDLINEVLLTDTYNQISENLPEGKLILVRLDSGQAGCFFITAINLPTVRSTAKLFNRVLNYLTSKHCLDAYKIYQKEYQNSEDQCIIFNFKFNRR
jgi:hypothetical protein